MTLSPLHVLAYPPVGRWLKAQRDVLGYTLSQASDQAQMRESTLQLLESERFLELPEPSFVKGYLRRYALVLKLDPLEVTALFDAWMQVHQAQHGSRGKAVIALSENTQTRRQHFSAYTGKINTLVGVALNSSIGQTTVVALCLGLFSFFLSHGSGIPQSTVASASSMLAVIAPEAPHQTVLPSTASSPTPATSPAIRMRASAPVTQQRHWLVASEITHVHVTDKHGLIVFSGLVRTASPVLLKGSKPFDIQAAKEGTVSLVNDRHLLGRHQRIAKL